ncbi:MAG: transposase [Thermodesulfobacteriota bacterium]|nr:transposase [Thermodesulfobacteriota bacterium]
MIQVKDHKTGYLFDPWGFLGKKRRKLMDKSWAGLFREKILCELPVGEFAKSFSEEYGRPTKELYAVLGTLILQQMLDLSDDETIEQFAFNLQWHYALDIMSTDESETYMCPRTLWGMRDLVIGKGLDGVLFNEVTAILAESFDVDASKQRIDSVHIRSNMRRLGRIRIFVQTINKFLVNLKRQHKELFDTLPEEMVHKYESEKALSAFSLVKPSMASNTLEKLSKDLFDLGQRFSDNEEVLSMSSYGLILRVLEEQCIITKDPKGKPQEVAVRSAKEVPSDSLQNPSDVDATYDGHKGQGYQVQVMETYTEDKDETTLNLITHVEVEPSHKSDVHALIPAIESAQDRGLGPQEVLADSLYGSDDNHEQAQKMGVELVAPCMGESRDESLSLADFECNHHGRIIKCPGGHAPVSHKIKKDRHNVRFALDACTACPHRLQCPVQKGKKNFYLRYTTKAMRIDRRRKSEHTDEFIDKYRYRAGVEATMSEYNTLTGVKRLRVRGMEAVRYCATLKAIGVNIFRATAVRRALMPSFDSFSHHIECFLSKIYRFATKFGLIISHCMKYTPDNDLGPDTQPIYAL